MYEYICAFVVVIVIIVLYKLLTWNTHTCDDYMYGFWVAEGDEFCEKSEVDSILVFIGEPTHHWRTTERTCYLIIMSNIANQGFTIQYTQGWAGIGLDKYRVRAKVTFDEQQLWTDKVDITIDLRDGTMKIDSVDNETKPTRYALLTKQHDTTNLAKRDNRQDSDAI